MDRQRAFGDQRVEPTPEELAAQEAGLEDRYVAGDVVEKGQIIEETGNLAPAQAVQVLSELFKQERDQGLRMRILKTLGNVRAEPEAKLPVLRRAVRRDQPVDVRDEALTMLESIDDRNALPVWLSLVKDPDETVSERAKEAVERLQKGE